MGTLIAIDDVQVDVVVRRGSNVSRLLPQTELAHTWLRTYVHQSGDTSVWAVLSREQGMFACINDALNGLLTELANQGFNVELIEVQI